MGTNQVFDPNKSQPSVCKRHVFWLDGDYGTVLVNVHLPKQGAIHNKVVIVCPPLGYEYTHSHRSLRHLCDHLAASGIVAIRFDYNGTGDSSGDLLDANRVECFQKNIAELVAWCKNTLSITQVSLLGLRLGATFSALYASRHPVDELILWAPCEKGKAYVREMRALDKLASHVNTAERHYIDSAGFIMSEQTADELAQINLNDLVYRVKSRVLLISRDDIPSKDKLIEQIQHSSGIQCESFTMQGYLGMMAEPQQTEVPSQTLHKIVDWVKPDNEPRRIVPEHDLMSPAATGKKRVSFVWNKGTSITETITQFADSRITAIISKPSLSRDCVKAPTIILSNSGSVHRVGPNRVYVEMARALAVSGFKVIRLDLRNLGDSVEGVPNNENNPYPAESTDDISAVMDELQSQNSDQTFILAGLCSGAHNVFHTALELDHSSAIEELIMINPLAFYRRPHRFVDNSKVQEKARNSAQYKESVLSLSKWKKLIKADVSYTYLLKFIVILFWSKLTFGLKSILEKFGVAPKSQLARDFIYLHDKKIKLTFFIASKDPGKALIMEQAKLQMIRYLQSGQIKLHDVPEADHTFSSKVCRDLFIQLFVKHIIDCYNPREVD